jgi:hypothetical protein
MYDPIAGNVSARNKGASIARGTYLFFSDAHMSYRVGSFRAMIEAIKESGGIVHPAITWMGGYPPEPVYQYSWELGQRFDGQWNSDKVADKWFYVPAMGHCCVGMKREQFLEYRGYPDYLRCYGGGGMFLDTKWWMLGSCAVTEPRAMSYHLTVDHGYTYWRDEYIHNIFHAAIILQAEAWAERVYLDYLREGRKERADSLWRDAEEKAHDQRQFVKQHRCMSFDDLIVRRPWDMLNDARVGRHNSGLVVMHDTWLTLMKGSPAEKELPGRYQEELAELIRTRLSLFVYKGSKPEDSAREGSPAI